MVLPNPRHFGQAPKGLLKEKRFGLGGGTGALPEHSAQLSSELNLLIVSGMTTTATRPSPVR